MDKKLSLDEFIDKSRQVHGDDYIYDKDKIIYVNSRTKVCVTCPVHGDFWITPNHHLKGQGCSICGSMKGKLKLTKSTETFIKEAKAVHGDDYIYDKTEYINSKKDVCIICKEHGEFWQRPSHHLSGCGCPVCGNGRSEKKIREKFNIFKDSATEVHQGKYSYPLYRNIVPRLEKVLNYVNNSTDICIVCPKHGEFFQNPSSHLKGCGCPICSNEERSRKLSRNTEGFIKVAREVHGDNYIYDRTKYIDSKSDVCITCRVHGDFWQEADSHLRGAGCPKCAHISSSLETEMNDYITKELHIDTVLRDRKLLDGLECDIIIPSYKLIIELDGLFWHSEKKGKDKNYHLHKTELAESKGYHLIHIFEDEWLEHKELVLDKIKHFLGCDTDKPVIGARKCTVKTLSKALVEEFLTSYHLQGFVTSTVYYGAFYEDILVSVMTFKQEKPNMWNLTRFVTNTDYRLPGLASKMFKQFIKDCNPVEVKTFLDRRWSHGDINVYDRMGFKMVDVLSPDYKYVVKSQRRHKFNFRKQILSKKYNLPLTMSEKEMTEKLGFYRIWDCGLYKYVWTKAEN